MSLPPEKIAELKQIIHTHLSQVDIQGRIKSVVSETLARDPGTTTVTENDIFETLRRKGVVEDLMQQLQFGSGGPDSFLKPSTHFINKDDQVTASTTGKKAPMDPTRRHLYLQVLGGKAFLEHLQEPEILPGQVSSTLTLHLFFRGQRFKSRPVPCACDPDIQEGFLLEIHKESAGAAGKMADHASLLSICDPIHIVLIKTEPSGESSIVTSHYLQWRPVLSAPSSRCSLSVELMGTGAESKVPIGLLEIKLELIPNLTETVGEDVISAQISLERNRNAERERLFLVYAKQWWKEFLQIRPHHKDRIVKIFAQDENSNNHPVCSYVSPLRAGRLLDTPRQASRFVSLIGYEKVSTLIGGEKAEQWSSMQCFLCRNKGDCEDHALLLCGLLLGFGLDAYVCVGTKGRGSSHTWVMTISTEGLVTFWESLTGHRYIHHCVDPDAPPAELQPKTNYPYKTIGCVFNHESFYANIQPLDNVDVCQFNFYNEALWKSMSNDAIRSVCGQGAVTGWPSIPPLCASVLDSALVSNDLEHELRALVMLHRRDQGLSTVWDDHLSYLLTPALAAYETERVTGLSAGNEEFQQAVRRAVPDGHTFKGYPIQFVHRNARRAFTACLKSPICEEIINCRGDHVRLAVRVRLFTYPESACATWIMFACKYKSIVA